MTTESNKSVLRNLLTAFEKGDTENVGKYFAANWVNHDPSLPPMEGLEGAKQLINLWSAFSNRKVTVEDSLAEGDRVAMRFSIDGTHTGAFMGIAPTGKKIHVTASGIFRVVDGKATDNWVNFDAMGLLQQLGAAPMPRP
ncbi:MAG TPA: ester cyclase [Anaerolineaceae bacterium]|nr:ester cyclase [Anaerolineaceae bacterium]